MLRSSTATLVLIFAGGATKSNNLAILGLEAHRHGSFLEAGGEHHPRRILKRNRAALLEKMKLAGLATEYSDATAVVE